MRKQKETMKGCKKRERERVRESELESEGEKNKYFGTVNLSQPFMLS